jgi:DNA invertase Pin-like site-specific DNA recombinase
MGLSGDASMSERTPAAILALRKAGRRRAAAEAERHAASAELRKRVREARAKGVNVSQIAREAGLSRQGVYDHLAESP